MNPENPERSNQSIGKDGAGQLAFPVAPLSVYSSGLYVQRQAGERSNRPLLSDPHWRNERGTEHKPESVSLPR